MDLIIIAIYLFAAVVTQGESLGSASNGDEPHLSVPRQHYSCPEGANVTLVCEEHGHLSKDLHLAWLFTPHMDHHCRKGQHPRGGRTPHTNTNHSLPLSALAVPGVEGSKILLVLTEVKKEDQGRYCCFLAEKQHKPSHNHVLLTVGPRREGSLACTELSTNSNEGTLSASFATAACIMAFLCLPLILVLVYRQRQTAQANRRAHELVRMDSEAQGHDNPVFLGGSPQVKTRTVSQILTRQSSETGRHLLSDPGTPLTPGYGEVFFPTQEPIPESPNILQV